MTDQSPLTIPDMLRASAQKFGTRTALWQRSGSQSEPETRTYEQVLAQARQFAAGLLALGLRRGDHVAIVAENSIEWALSFLGISLAGGVAVPIYYRLAEDEQAMLMRSADVRFACIGLAPDDRAPGGLRHVERLILLGGTVRRQERERGLRALLRTLHGHEPLAFQEVASHGSAQAVDQVAVSPDDLATLLFTSGTTGTPKAVMLSHRNILSNVWAVKEVVHVGAEDRLLLVLPMHHPFPLTLGLVMPLAIGAMVAYENDLRRVRERMAEVQPTVFFGVPELYRLLLRAIFQRAEAEGQAGRLRTALKISGWVKRLTGVNIGPLLFRSLHRRLGGRIRFLASGGAALPPELAQQYYRMGLLLVQGWGLSETAPVLTVQEIDVKKFLFTRHYERLAGTVGRPIPGVRLRLLDVPEKEVVASRNGEGELAAQGPNVMLGYYKDPAATAAVIFEDESGRWFRTGDLGRITPDGYVYLTGRVKSVIVLDTGEKVAPDEVEDVLRESPYILDVAVIGRQPGKYVGTGKVEVHAVIYPSYEELRKRAEVEGVPLTAERAHQWITAEVKRLQQQRLAPYKWVRQVILTDQPLPKTPLGKVRRGLLMEHYAFDLERFVASSGAGQAT